MPGFSSPDLVALQILIAVSETGSLSAAGRKVGMTQQAASARMRGLESRIGVDLFVRSPRGSALTVAGRVVAGWADEVIASAERLEAGIAALRSENRRELKVAASLTIAEYLLPRWMVTLRGRQDAAGETPTRIGLTAANSEAVLAMVRSGDVALGFIETVTIPTDLRVRSLGFDELLLAVAPQHPWAKRKGPIAAQELARTPLVTREPGSGTRQSLEQLLLACDGVETTATPHIELTSTAAVRAAIASGAAPGVLSGLALADDLALGRLRALKVDGVSLRRQLSAVWSAGKTPALGPAQDLLAVALTG